MDFSTQLSSGKLEFSRDTVYLDTVFTNIGSSTYRLKVYNRENHAITIPSIRLGRGVGSGYRLNVDGKPGQFFENVDILAKDSIYIFIETTINYNAISDPLYVDELLFDAGINEQKVNLVTLVQNAHFLFPSKTNGVIETLVLDGQTTLLKGRYLTDNELTFTNQKPYVIYGYMAVGDAQNNPKTLTIQPGAKVYFHANSGLIVNPNSSLHINGILNVDGFPETEVILQGDRLEHSFKNIPGQWGTIWLRQGSVNNQIQYATIKNGNIGLLVDGYTNANTPVLNIQNTQIYNFSQFGIFARLSNILGKNLVFNNFGMGAFAGTQGGVYDFLHCTFANYWSGIRSFPTVYLNNFYTEDQVNYVAFHLNRANFTNCIVYGSNNIELKLEKVNAGNFNYLFTNNLIRFNDAGNNFTNNPLYNFTNTNHFVGNLFNLTPDFKNDFIKINKMWVGANSAGKTKALWDNATQLIPTDITGKPRPNPADLGAYQSVIFE